MTRKFYWGFVIWLPPEGSTEVERVVTQPKVFVAESVGLARERAASEPEVEDLIARTAHEGDKREGMRVMVHEFTDADFAPFPMDVHSEILVRNERDRLRRAERACEEHREALNAMEQWL